MKRNTYIWSLYGLTILVFAILIIFMPLCWTTSLWIALGCTAASFLLVGYTISTTVASKESVFSRLLGLPVLKASAVALAVQLVVFLLVALVGHLLPLVVTSLVEILVMAGSAFVLLQKEGAADFIATSEAQVTNRTEGWKAIRAKANALAATSGNPQLKKLAEEIRYADPTPTSMDAEIDQMLDTLSSYADGENIKKAFGMVEQRKTAARENK